VVVVEAAAVVAVVNTQTFVCCEMTQKHNGPSIRMKSKNENFTDFIQQNSSCEAYSHCACQEIFHLLLNQTVHYHVFKSLPLIPVLSQMNPVHFLLFCFFKI